MARNVLPVSDPPYAIDRFLLRCLNVEGVAVDKADADTWLTEEGLDEALWLIWCSVLKTKAAAAKVVING